MEKLINFLMSEGIEEVELLIKERKEKILTFQNSILLPPYERELKEFSARGIKEGKLGFVPSAEVFDFRELARQLLISTNLGPKVNFHFPYSGSCLPKRKVFDPALEDITCADLISQGREILAKLTQLNSRINANFNISLIIEYITIVNSNGTYFKYPVSELTYQLTGIVEGSKTGVTRMLFSSKFVPFPQEKLEEIAFYYSLANNLVDFKLSSCPVILDPQAGWTLFYRFYTGVNGENILKGVSPLAGKVGERIFSPKLSILDDPTLDYLPGSIPVDDEGVLTSRKILVEKGVLKGFIFDLFTASGYGTSSTGNGLKHTMWMKGMEFPPRPNFTTLFCQPGNLTVKEMITSLEEGILIEEVLGFHSGNILAGDFSVNVGMGYLIKNGKPRGRVGGCMVSGNIYSLFNDDITLSKECEAIGRYYIPYLKLGKINITN